jgi:hypothetical protein
MKGASEYRMKILAETYKKFTVEGFPLNKSLPLLPGAASLRIVVREAGSGMIGPITVALTGL